LDELERVRDLEGSAPNQRQRLEQWDQRRQAKLEEQRKNAVDPNEDDCTF